MRWRRSQTLKVSETFRVFGLPVPSLDEAVAYALEEAQT